jgi:hypothetical protein
VEAVIGIGIIVLIVIAVAARNKPKPPVLHVIPVKQQKGGGCFPIIAIGVALALAGAALAHL